MLLSINTDETQKIINPTRFLNYDRNDLSTLGHIVGAYAEYIDNLLPLRETPTSITNDVRKR